MSGALTGPVGAEEFAALIGDLAPFSSPIALAVSGGPDSMALAACIKRWGKTPCVAFIVDHALRAESAQEASAVKTRLEQMGMGADILRWQHDGIQNRVHEKARQARYELLTEACARTGARDLLTAHHADDQAETILMRFCKGSGVEGLAGMSSQTTRGEVRLLRPFLSIPKQRLIATCQAAGIAFVSDPSNQSDIFARGRLRKILPLLTDEGLSTGNLLRIGKGAGETAQALHYYVKQFLLASAEAEIGGSVRFDRAALRDIPRAIAARAIARGLRYVHPDDYPPEQDALHALLDLILGPAEETAQSFYGCITSLGANKVTILREPASVQKPLDLPAGETVLWDKRWLISAAADSKTARVGALGDQTHDIIDRLAPGLRHKIPQGRIRACLPAIWVANEMTAIPSFAETGNFRMTYRKQSFP